MRVRAVAVLLFARIATGFISTSTRSTWVAPRHDRRASRCRSSNPRRWLSRRRAQPSAAVGGDSASAGGGVGTGRIAKPSLKVKSGQRGGGYHVSARCCPREIRELPVFLRARKLDSTTADSTEKRALLMTSHDGACKSAVPNHTTPWRCVSQARSVFPCRGTVVKAGDNASFSPAPQE